MQNSDHGFPINRKISNEIIQGMSNMFPRIAVSVLSIKKSISEAEIFVTIILYSAPQYFGGKSDDSVN